MSENSSLMLPIKSWVAKEGLADDDADCLINAINLREVVTKLVLAGHPRGKVRAALPSSVDHCVEFDIAQAIEAGEMAIQTQYFGLSFGQEAVWFSDGLF